MKTAIIAILFFFVANSKVMAQDATRQNIIQAAHDPQRAERSAKADALFAKKRLIAGSMAPKKTQKADPCRKAKSTDRP